jgi:CHAD domain-containing protein
MVERDSLFGTARASEVSLHQASDSDHLQIAPAPVELNPSTPATDAAAKAQSVSLGQIIVSQLESLRAYHQAVMETDEPEAIHKMRVTTRRLQASLDLLQTNGDELHIRRIKKRLRKWRRTLSLVRNYDVFLNLIEQERPTRSAAHQRRFELLKSILRDRRAHIIQKARARLQGAIIDDLAARLGVMLTEQPVEQTVAEALPDGQTMAETLPDGQAVIEAAKKMNIDEEKVTRRTTQRLEQRLGEFQALAAQAHPTSDPDEAHQLRIAAKRLRYLLEIISEMGFGSAMQALTWLRSLQDRIGDWHDLEALEEEILSITTRKKFVKEHINEAAQMLQAAAHLQKKKDALIAKLFPITVPNTVTGASYRLARSLRRHSLKIGSGS